jgi:hypothetical protein
MLLLLPQTDLVIHDVLNKKQMDSVPEVYTAASQPLAGNLLLPRLMKYYKGKGAVDFEGRR